MARSVDSRTWAAWRQRLQRFEQSSLSVARFCDQEGVSPASFYRWRRQLARVPPDAARSAVTPACGTTFAPVALIAPRTLAVELPGGTRLHIPAGDHGLLAAAIAAVAAADAQWRQAGAAC